MIYLLDRIIIGIYVFNLLFRSLLDCVLLCSSLQVLIMESTP